MENFPYLLFFPDVNIRPILSCQARPVLGDCGHYKYNLISIRDRNLLQSEFGRPLDPGRVQNPKLRSLSTNRQNCFYDFFQFYFYDVLLCDEAREAEILGSKKCFLFKKFDF